MPEDELFSLETEALAHEETEPDVTQEGDGNQEGDAQGNVQSDAQEDGSQGQQGRGNEPREGLRSQPRRENDSVRALRERAQAAESAAQQERIRAQAYADQLAHFNQRPDPAALLRQQQEEQQRLEMMAPHEVAQYLAQKSEQRVAVQLQIMQRQQADAMDKIAFQGLKRDNPLANKYEKEVERLVAQEAAKGITVQRETALAFVIGEFVLKNAPAAAKRQAAAAAKRVTGNTVNPGGAAGDVASEPRGRSGNDLAALERRLAGKFI